MAATPPENESPRDKMTGDELRAHALRDGFVLDDWSVNTDFLAKNEMDQEYPWEDVEAARHNARLQKRHRGKERVAEGLPAHFAYVRPCPTCGAASEKLSWFYFESPKETWPNECGVAGWMAVCDPCHIQINLFGDVVS